MPEEVVKIIGEWPRVGNGRDAVYKRVVGTVFPDYKAIVCVPGIHMHQRIAFINYLNEERRKSNKPLLTSEEEEHIYTSGVDLFFRDKDILIRPQADRMDLAFQADELLQTKESKLRIKFLQATDKDILLAIKKRGECWRINPLPRSQAEIEEWIRSSKTAIGLECIYYHNMITGVRYLTYENFAGLEKLPIRRLAEQLEEIKVYSKKKNQLGYPEVTFFQADTKIFNAELFQNHDFLSLSSDELLRVYRELREKFKQAVRDEMRYEDFNNLVWRNTMYSALIGHEEGIVADSILRGLSPEYFMQLEWLPGGRIEEGELIFDSVFDELDGNNGNSSEVSSICDIRVKNFIFNFIREFGDIEYINIARVPMSLSKREKFMGHRGVYLAEVKTCSSPDPVVRIIRMQKWDIIGHLDDGKSLLDAMLLSEEYTEYVLDRRLACRQLGMNLPAKILMHKISEVYEGKNTAYRHRIVWSTYFERDYQSGIATDKIPAIKFSDVEYAKRFAALLGKAAAPNMIVGRTSTDVIDSMNVLFDDGDEIVVEDKEGMPSQILIADPTGAFGNFRTPLEEFAEHYAMPVVKRWEFLADKEGFIFSYLEGFIKEFIRIQNDYWKRRRAFDSLFKHRPRNEAGSFAYRWECVLKRLDSTDPIRVAACIDSKIREMVKNKKESLNVT